MSRLTVLLLLVFTVTCCWCCSATAQKDKLVGVGIAISFDGNDNVWIAKVVSGGPAARAGIKEGDKLLAIDGRSVTDFPKAEVLNRIRGTEGSEISLTVRTKGGRTRKVTMKRTAMAMNDKPSHAAPRPSPPGSNLPQPQTSPKLR